MSIVECMCPFRDCLEVKCGLIVLNFAHQQGSTFEDLLTEGLKSKPNVRSNRVNRIHNTQPSISTYIIR